MRVRVQCTVHGVAMQTSECSKEGDMIFYAQLDEDEYEIEALYFWCPLGDEEADAAECRAEMLLVRYP